MKRLIALNLALIFILGCSGMPFYYPKPEEPAVVLVDIDDQSIKQYGQWPWSRRILGEIIEKLEDAGAKVVVMDMLLCDNDRCDPEGDMDLGNILAGYDNVFVNVAFLEEPLDKNPDSRALKELPPLALNIPTYPEWHHAGDALIPIPPVSKNCRLATPAVLLDSKGKVSTVPMFFCFDERVYPSTSLSVSAYYLDIPIDEIKYNHNILAIELGNKTIPITKDGDLRVRFRPPYSRFRHSSAAIVLSQPASNLKPFFENKVVILGANALALADHHVTSIANYFPGPEILATGIQTILEY